MVTRNDAVQKYKFEMTIQEQHCLTGQVTDCIGYSKIWNRCAPPNGSYNYKIEMVWYLAQVGYNDFGFGDLTWVGSAAKQRSLQGIQTSDEQNDVGKKYLARRDEDI